MFDGRIISGITVFVAVAEAGSYARASEAIGLSRSGIGKSIARLEERTGLRLFDRTSRALKLTDEGRTFLAEVAPLLDRLGEAAAPAEPNSIRGHLRVSCDAAFGVYCLMPAMSQFAERHPRLKIDLIVRDRVENLLAEGFDVAIRFGEPELRGLDKQFLFESRIVTCASPDYVAQHGLPKDPANLEAAHRCIRLIDAATGKPRVWCMDDANGERQRIAPSYSVSVSDAPSLMSGITSGCGIGRALDFMVAEQLSSGELVEVLPEWNHHTWPAYLCMPHRTHRSSGISAFTAFVLEQRFGVTDSAPVRTIGSGHIFPARRTVWRRTRQGDPDCPSDEE